MAVRRALIVLLAVILTTAAGLHAPHAQEQARQQDGQFAALYERWQQEQDPERRIPLGEELLALEQAQKSWPLAVSRARLRAEVSFELGSAYAIRPRGVRADNLERAIGYFDAALQEFTFANDPQEWARAHNNAGIAHWSRVRGERADNQERAIAHFEAALKVFTRDTAPRAWAQLQNNLAIVQASRIRGVRTANIELSIAHFEAALTVFKRETEPLLWASAQNNLGLAYSDLRRGEREDNRDKAIAHIDAALTVFTRETVPHEWASARFNLAAIYIDRERGSRGDNRETALEHLEAALTVFTLEAFPEQWAKVQLSIGDAYASRVRGLRSGNRQLAIAAYESALTVFTRDAYPRFHMKAGRQLGRMLLQIGNWYDAEPAYAGARDAFLLLFGEGFEEAEARALIADAGSLFAEAAYAAIQRGDNEAALTLADEGRARLLAVSLRLQTLDLPADQRRRLDDLRAEIRTTLKTLESATGTDRSAALETLAMKRQALLALVKAGGTSDDRHGIALAEARRVAAAGGAVAISLVTEHGGKLIVVTAPVGDSDIAVIDLPDLTPIRLSELLVGSSGGAPSGWIAPYFVNYLEGAEQTQRWPEWLDAVDRLGPALWRLVGARLDATLKERGIRRGAPLLWLPSGWLGVLPLGIAQHPVIKQRFADDYDITVAPSLAALAAARRHTDTAAPATLTAIVNPTGDLPGADKEGAIVASHFTPEARRVLAGEQATPEAVLAALKGQTHWHFASHGTFSWSDVRSSALIMHGPTRLSIGLLQAADGLGHPRLVVLSACETGLLEIISNPDEFIGLPSTFMALGAAGVVGTLWPVNDTATALLMARFYELHIAERLSPASALSRAQAWLRTATNIDLQAYVESAVASARLAPDLAEQIVQELSADGLRRSRNSPAVEWIKRQRVPEGSVQDQEPQRARPFAHPYFWAGFVHTGL
jgi:CHAT domain-containing protein/tetratricopeptide (TPR) repeat protein